MEKQEEVRKCVSAQVEEKHLTTRYAREHRGHREIKKLQTSVTCFAVIKVFKE